MKTVALLGGAETTRDLVKDSQADEIWTMNWNYLYDWVPRIDRLFEIHKVWMLAHNEKEQYIKPRKHWKWLHKKHPYPIYMLGQFDQIPSSVAYPINEVSANIFGERLIRGEEPHDFFTSTVDYMLGLAIYEEFDVIELYGIEMGSTTEYRYQREGAAFFTGVAVARGITVKRPANSILLRGKRYGYEGAQMIYRQDLERMLAQWEVKQRDEIASMQNLEGRMQYMLTESADEDEQMALAQRCGDARDRAAIASGWVQCLRYQIAEIDLEEPPMELVNVFEKVIVQ